MDTDAGRLAGDTIEAGAEQLAALARQIDAVLQGLEWDGPDADRTRDAWQAVERPALDSTAEHLTGLVALIRREADEQDRASESGTNGGAVGPGAISGGAGVDGSAGSPVRQVLEGGSPSVAAIAAGALAGTGQAGGELWNTVTGHDDRILTEGEGRAGTPVAVPTDPTRAGEYQPVLTPPTDLGGLMQGVSDGYAVGDGPGSTGDVRITRVDNGGTPAYVVAVPGTENWSPVAGEQPRDLTANLHLVAGNPTAAAQSVQRAMDAAGIPPGSPVLLVGHSQGGIIAAQLASDPAFVERYGVTNVVTYGAPIDHLTVDPRVDVLQMKHRFDVVPTLDLGGLRTDGSTPTSGTSVTLDSPGAFWDVGASHSYTAYVQSVRDAIAAGTPEGQALAAYQAQLAPFLVAPGGSASAVDVPVSRAP